MYSPRWLFLLPGIVFVLLGIVGYAVALPGVTISGLGSLGQITFDLHTLLFASVFILCGSQAIQFAIFTKIFAVTEGLHPEDPRMNRFFEIVNLERGLVFSSLLLATGLVILLIAVNDWRLTGFGRLDYAQTMRWVIPGSTMTALGVQTLFSSFFASVLGMKRK